MRRRAAEADRSRVRRLATADVSAPAAPAPPRLCHRVRVVFLWSCGYTRPRCTTRAAAPTLANARRTTPSVSAGRRERDSSPRSCPARHSARRWPPSFAEAASGDGLSEHHLDLWARLRLAEDTDASKNACGDRCGIEPATHYRRFQGPATTSYVVVDPLTTVLFFTTYTLHVAPAGTGWTLTVSMVVGGSPGSGSNHGPMRSNRS